MDNPSIRKGRSNMLIKMWALMAIIPVILVLGFSVQMYYFNVKWYLTNAESLLKTENIRYSQLRSEITRYEYQGDSVSVLITIADLERKHLKEVLIQTTAGSLLWTRSEADWKKFLSLTENMDQQKPEGKELARIVNILDRITQRNNETIALFSAGIEETDQKRVLYGAAFLVLAIASGFLIYRYFRLNFEHPLSKILQVTTAAATGIVSEKTGYYKNDEIGSIAQALDQIIENQGKVAVFAEKIGDGNFESDYTISGPGDKIGISLSSMREKLIKVAEEDRRRQWANEGLAKFAGLLRTDNENPENLCDNIIRNLVKYLNVNQGRIYITSEEDGTRLLVLKAAYAWERKKHIEQSIQLGEGLVGQAGIEMEPIFLTDIPAGYISITSGTGAATPRCIIVQPLVVNNTLQGVIELAAFNVVMQYERDFLDKIAEMIASALAGVKTNETTRRLLDESRRMTENLQTQEEELRQNTIELRATQENLHRLLEEAREEMRHQIVELEAEKSKNIAILEGCVDGVITFDQSGKIEFFNRSAEMIWNCKRSEALKKSAGEILNVDIINLGNSYEVWHNGEHGRKLLDVRSEITLRTSDGSDCPVLITLSKARIGDQFIFTAFIQSIAVELF
jgi:PAS domain S-box-containing protein